MAADSMNSAVRKQYLPSAEPTDTGVVGIGATIPLTDGVMALAPHLLLDGPVMVVPPAPCSASMFMAMWKRLPGRPARRCAGLALRDRCPAMRTI